MRSLRLIIKITLIHPHSDRSHHRIPWQQPLVTRIIFWALKIPSSFYWLILSVPIPDPRGDSCLVVRWMTSRVTQSFTHWLGYKSESSSDLSFIRLLISPIQLFIKSIESLTHSLNSPPATPHLIAATAATASAGFRQRTEFKGI